MKTSIKIKIQSEIQIVRIKQKSNQHEIERNKENGIQFHSINESETKVIFDVNTVDNTIFECVI